MAKPGWGIMIQKCIEKLVDKTDLSRDEAAGAMQSLMSGEASSVQVAAFLTALRMKGETVNEITGLAETMRALATKISSKRSPLVDTCGTGGDRLGTFNISTTAAFVVAGAGVAVAKHGNRSATSKCGSADVLESLGVNLDITPEQVERCIDETGIGFLFARALHGAMKHVAPVRAELKIRTVFNILGPLTNPAGADGQVVGVFDRKLVPALAEVLRQLGARHAFVVAGSDGLDEITLSGATDIAEAQGPELRTYQVTPMQFGLKQAGTDAIRGGDAEENAEILRAVLAGAPGAHRDIVVLNAAPAIMAGQKADNWDAGIAAAQEAIDSGAAMRALEELIRVSHDS